MGAIHSENRYSAAVRLRLQLPGMVVRIAQIGDGFLVLREPCEAPPNTLATVVISVDQAETHYPVVLPEGILRDLDIVEFIDLESCQLVNAVGAICTRTGPVHVEWAAHPSPN